MTHNGENENKHDKDEIEQLLDDLWKNWESRRRCEKTHVPKYIKREKTKKEI